MRPMEYQNFFNDFKNAAVIVAHPDDETLWSGGTILSHPHIQWTIMSLSRKSDPDRAPKFSKAAEIYRAKGLITDLDDGPEQNPVSIFEIETLILNELQQRQFDLVITHNIRGEYTRHLRHEEVSQAVAQLIKSRKIVCKKFLNFAYEDGGKKYLPKPQADADLKITLQPEIWEKKKFIISNTYSFSPDSFEAKVCSNIEAFRIM
ncbi:MAG: PIG-L family deacetylase [Phycisphaerales bacterium]